MKHLSSIIAIVLAPIVLIPPAPAQDKSLQKDSPRRVIDQHPELTIEAIAANCGFNAPGTFYRLFRKHHGITPSEYRRMTFDVADGEPKLPAARR